MIGADAAALIVVATGGASATALDSGWERLGSLGVSLAVGAAMMIYGHRREAALSGQLRQDLVDERKAGREARATDQAEWRRLEESLRRDLDAERAEHARTRQTLFDILARE